MQRREGDPVVSKARMGRVRLAAAALAAAALAAGCVRGEAGTATVTVRTASGPVAFIVEVADSGAERRRGLSGRSSLGDRSGMLFRYAEEASGGFWMKDTSIPLSIAFLDDTGRVLALLAMEPCVSGPCPVYDPGISYRAALEVNRGALERLGVGVGDSVSIEEGGAAIGTAPGG